MRTAGECFPLFFYTYIYTHSSSYKYTYTLMQAHELTHIHTFVECLYPLKKHDTVDGSYHSHYFS